MNYPTTPSHDNLLGYAFAVTMLAFLLHPSPGMAQAPVEANVALNRAAYHSSAINYDNVAHLATDGSLDTFWQSGIEDQPWIYVDLGQTRKISGVELAWGSLAPSGCAIQISNETAERKTWKSVVRIPCAASQTNQARFTQTAVRYVRVLVDSKSAPGGCQLNEFKVLGEPSLAPRLSDLTLPAADRNNRISLDGSDWRLQNTLFTRDSGETISKAGYPAQEWLPARVPGTVLANYLANGAVPDPNFGDQQRLISESFFQNDFWFRREFEQGPAISDQHFLLMFEGINWKADIYINGAHVGHIDGAFSRGIFEVTHNLLPNQTNALAVLIHKAANPGLPHEKSLGKDSRNGGVLGKDQPTFQATIGWNWMPTIRGRDIGIWDHVYLEQTGPLLLADPFVVTTVAKDRKHADLTLKATLRNLENRQMEGAINGTLANIAFSQKVSLAPNETKNLTLDKAACPELSVANPPLWWPNGYGEQPLQHLILTVAAGAAPTSQKEVIYGIRELTYDTSDNILKILCNGQRIQLNGGNWGMDETMLRYEAKDYDIAVRLHKEMHMTMIRNWIGHVGKEEFFEACDKYGLLVWNDFWLSTVNPDDHQMFMDNVRDRILRIRNHPSLALYCGENEGMPPKDLDAGMAQETAKLDGTRFYIPDSAGGLVTGHGPYEPHPASWYFHNTATKTQRGEVSGGIGNTLHSELGIVTRAHRRFHAPADARKGSLAY